MTGDRFALALSAALLALTAAMCVAIAPRSIDVPTMMARAR